MSKVFLLMLKIFSTKVGISSKDFATRGKPAKSGAAKGALIVVGRWLSFWPCFCQYLLRSRIS
jgi:hypothetical protein